MILAALTEASQNKRTYLDLEKAYRVEASAEGGTTLFFAEGPVGVTEEVSSILSILRKFGCLYGVE